MLKIKQRIIVILLVISLVSGNEMMVFAETNGEEQLEVVLEETISEDKTDVGYWSDEGNYDTLWYDNNPSLKEYLLNTASELAGLAVLVDNGIDFHNVTIKLASDIDLSANEWNPIGSYVSDSDNKPFRGTFDGQENVITGLKAFGEYSALFAYINGTVTIKNLVMKDIEVSARSYVAAVAAYANAGTGEITIDNCYLTGKVTEPDGFWSNQYSAAVISYLDAQKGTATISNCELYCSVSNTRYTGAVVGYASGNVDDVIRIENCHNYSGITGGDDSEYCGGIAGYARYVKFSKCSNYGSVYGNSTNDDDGSLWHGGIAGSGANVTFIDCANYGEIKAWLVGGLIASSSNGLVAKNCLNVGKLTHKSMPDGDGYALFYDGEYENCYYVSG